MVRVTNAVARHRRRKRLMKQAKGFFGDRKNHLRLTKDAVMKAMAYNYIHRKKKKSEFRKLWIMRISVAAKIHGISYSRFMDGLKKAGCLIDRKMLSEIAIHDPKSFEAVIVSAKAALA
ncbi:MAG: 50S ribosomal protein L20 [Rhabdochlamydiaceae bacterium]|nr:50S ribosomal protein L20 [Candidatus Amphrikana amoebophyrae]